jgi:hypothetical protein
MKVKSEIPASQNFPGFAAGKSTRPAFIFLIPSQSPHDHDVMIYGYRWDARIATRICGKITTYYQNRHTGTEATQKLRQHSYCVEI